MATAWDDRPSALHSLVLRLSHPDGPVSTGARMRSPASSGPQLPTKWGEMGLWPQGSAPTRMTWPLPMRSGCRSYQVSKELGLGKTS